MHWIEVKKEENQIKTCGKLKEILLINNNNNNDFTHSIWEKLIYEWINSYSTVADNRRN